MTITPERLRELREAAGLSVLQLAARMTVQTAYIYQLEKGTRPIGSRTLAKYVAAGVVPREEATDALLGPIAGDAA